MTAHIYDAPREMEAWSVRFSEVFDREGMEVGLRMPTEGSDLNKAVVTFESSVLVASVTAWGQGSLEFIALSKATKEELMVFDRSFQSAEELRASLDECVKLLRDLASG